MSEQPPKQHPTLADLQDQIGALREGHLSLNQRLDDQSEELRDNTRATKRMDEELRENTKTTKATADKADRIDARTARMVELFEDGTGFVRTLARIADWGKKIAWLTVPWAFILGGARAAWHWISGGHG